MTLNSFIPFRAGRQQVRNPLQHHLGLKEHLVIPKTQHLVSLFSQKITSRFVLSTSEACCSPSSSIINRYSRQQKSVINGPIGRCRRNLAPDNCRARSHAQENAPLPSAPAAVARVREVWMAYPRSLLYQHQRISVISATSLKDTPRAGLRTQHAALARG
jgi:hypothetical protein